ncbi:Fe(3+) ABC transporter substrate-binding protein [Phocoenobacter skyensis]|uniref:Fe(3+) ABC transporter substrate-binding protein n=1 Tax=Phocoenobacter skyensis TaxID=97481 RepID=A0A1H7WAP7_9PAST|nr:Fe(3+) ABC transporter substrate-binding protein [Pasteurella skyensis]MDP8079169.1 Fe(3+) ABC transporter substrate-binding protein [Pasteurella skyensis]MDP8085119.1 Fe(3+) ABC transporter substrate-binding protein [Pasteurella skyensis]MDP8163070.1 Fe(3+) ABC transporter substrate-binding protein [Pasteurella skyensis]MDP8170106.1 Fe(3+) ABC transporter substrate-binding protein [Pasteurella skyensis]MDP8173550.1 Fe(3+) ABC transporter substrate-binding protein [Pasteurella skyensis]
MKKMLSTCALALPLVLSTSALAKNEVNVYSYRQPHLINPMLEQFEKDTGIKVNVLFSGKGLIKRIQAEGELSPADLLLTVDISRVMELVNEGFAQKVKSTVLEKNIPYQFRDSDGDWFALTTRARAIYTSKDRVGKLPAGFDYIDLAKPEYKGKICIRSGKNAYNVSLFASLIEHYGVDKTRDFLKGLKANLARKPQGNDRAQIKGIAAGVCDYAIANSYYFGKMLTDEKQKAQAEKAIINFPTGKYATHLNISGMALSKYAPNKANAIKLMEYLSENTAQKLYAELNHEFPVKEGVERSKLVASWGEFTADKLQLEKIAEHYKQALQLVDEVQFDIEK